MNNILGSWWSSGTRRQNVATTTTTDNTNAATLSSTTRMSVTMATHAVQQQLNPSIARGILLRTTAEPASSGLTISSSPSATAAAAAAATVHPSSSPSSAAVAAATRMVATKFTNSLSTTPYSASSSSSSSSSPAPLLTSPSPSSSLESSLSFGHTAITATATASVTAVSDNTATATATTTTIFGKQHYFDTMLTSNLTTVQTSTSPSSPVTASHYTIGDTLSAALANFTGYYKTSLNNNTDWPEQNLRFTNTTNANTIPLTSLQIAGSNTTVTLITNATTNAITSAVSATVTASNTTGNDLSFSANAITVNESSPMNIRWNRTMGFFNLVNASHLTNNNNNNNIHNNNYNNNNNNNNQNTVMSLFNATMAAQLKNLSFPDDDNNDNINANALSFNNLWNCTKFIDCGLTNLNDTINSTDFDFNYNNNFTNNTAQAESTIIMVTLIVTAVILGIVILATVIGNVFVIAAILLERNLQSVSNYLILSLAVADLLVACLVMPLSAVYEISREWRLGAELCDMWTSSDVLCCTASILHLVAIALDRYWAVTNIDYVHHRTGGRIGMMILVVWALSLLVSIAPLFGWKDPDWENRVMEDRVCIVSQDIGYQIFATVSSFYLPLTVILVLYYRIFQTARKRIRRRQQGKSIIQLLPRAFVIQPPQGGSTGGGGGGGGNSAGGGGGGVGSNTGNNNSSNGSNSGGGGGSSGIIASVAGGTGGIAAAVVTVIGRPLPTISETTTAFTNVSSTNTSPEKNSYGNGVDCDPPTSDSISATAATTYRSSALETGGGCGSGDSGNGTGNLQQLHPNAALHQQQHHLAGGGGGGGGGGQRHHPHGPTLKPSTISRKRPQNAVESKRERKAAKTLAIITGAFVCCWLPFFILAILMPACKQCNVSPLLISIFLWLGYFNSTLNPIIYTIFSPEFRNAFKRILCGRKNSINRKRKKFGVKR